MLYVPQPRAPVILPYDRMRALDYAHQWAYKRNPKYYNFDSVGGDCTNYASQVIFAGSEIMNYTPVYGWYYIDSYKRTPSWTGVNYLHNFLVDNKGPGPFAELVDVKDIEPGDIIQLSFHGGNNFHHSPVVVHTGNPASIDNILIAAHTYDRDHTPLTSYSWVNIRFIHIKGVRKM